MDKKSRTTLERLQRTVDNDRPSDDERLRVADQLITQDQVRRLDPRLKKLAPLPPSRSRKGPPSARDIVSQRAQAGSREPVVQGPGRAEHRRRPKSGEITLESQRWR
jgi:hypothetical protein